MLGDGWLESAFKQRILKVLTFVVNNWGLGTFLFSFLSIIPP